MHHSPNICDTCANAIIDAYKTVNTRKISWTKLHNSHEGFLTSIEKGCTLCSYLENRRKMLRPKEVYFPASIGVQEKAVVDDEKEHHVNFMVLGSHRDPRVGEADFGQFFLRRVKKDAAVEGYRERYPYISDYSKVSSSGSPECLALVNAWLRQCLTSHPICRQVRDESHRDWMPTRLVHCGLKPRIVESKELTACASYLTLSHCWGKISDRICLTRATLQQWKKELPELGRMKTFRDAIDIARSLGIDYIWIDSLCIIQDSVSDWVIESGTMARVYKYALCNISATSAKDDSEGCFLPRVPGRPPLPCFQLALPISEGAHLLQNYEFNLLLPGSMIEEVTYGAVNARGWVLQERIMAARIIHFCRSQIYWECNEWSTQESNYYRTASQDVLMHERTWHTRPRLIEQGKIQRHYSDAPEILMKWIQLLTTYVATQLTKSDDILVAISALAREAQHYLQCEYHAGLFERDIMYQLCWSRKMNSEHRGSSNSTTAPSWSWASFVGVKYFSILWLKPIMLAEYLGAEVDLCDNDPFGRVNGGKLKLRGRILPIHFSPREPLIQSPGWVYEGTSDPGQDKKEEKQAWANFQSGNECHQLSGIFSSDEAELPYGQESGRSFYALPLLYQINTLIAVLILELLEGGEYRRIGYLNSNTMGRGKRKLSPHEDGDMALLEVLGRLVWHEQEEKKLSDLIVDTTRWETVSIV